MLKAIYTKHTLQFKKPSGTSRGVLKTKECWFIKLWEDTNIDICGIGECGLLKGLSYDDRTNYEQKLKEVCQNIEQIAKDDFYESLKEWPSIIFALEMALLDLKNGGKRIFHPSNFTQKEAPIEINGLIWMGTPEFMETQIQDKLRGQYNCIKLKIGAINFEEEYALLQNIRKTYPKHKIELRVDANGAFRPNNALDKLYRLAKLDIHSIEQPIRQKQWTAMAYLCKETPLPIALDEELIGIKEYAEKQRLLEIIQPQYIILKPSLVGGYRHSLEWIELAEKQGIGWWITSALESNIGLNAIAQFTYYLIHSTSQSSRKIPQGLGTGQLYTNNIDSPLYIKNGNLYLNSENEWDIEKHLTF